MNKPDDTELAWAAGFFDGEGHVRSKSGRTREIQVSQKTRECLERLQKIFATGTIGGPYHAKNPVYFWYVTKTCETDRVLNWMWPFLCSVKQRQATKVGFKVGYCANPKLGRPHGYSDSKPKCHPDRKYVGRGLCEQCYHRERYRKLNNVDASKWRVK